MTNPVDPAFLTHLRGQMTTLQVCWLIERRDATFLRGTAHDSDILIPSGPYAGTYRADTAVMASNVRSASDGSIQNLEVQGGFQVNALIPDLTVADVEAGLYANARAVLLMVNWKDPSKYKVLCAGTLGEFYYDSNNNYKSEVRGLTQKLKQRIIRTAGERCDIQRFGEPRCGKDVPSITRTGVIATVTNRKTFTVTLSAGPAPIGDPNAYYVGGRFVATSGPNTGFEKEIKTANLSGSTLSIVLFEEMPNDFVVGDAVSVPPGCNKLFSTCKGIHNNLINFQGYAIYASGKDALMRAPESA